MQSGVCLWSFGSRRGKTTSIPKAPKGMKPCLWYLSSGLCSRVVLTSIEQSDEAGLILDNLKGSLQGRENEGRSVL